jgi:hypothetical protein
MCGSSSLWGVWAIVSVKDARKNPGQGVYCVCCGRLHDQTVWLSMWGMRYFVWYEYMVCGTYNIQNINCGAMNVGENSCPGSGCSLVFVWYNIQNIWRLCARNAEIIPVEKVAGLSSTCCTIYRICGGWLPGIRGEFLSRKWPLSLPCGTIYRI